MTLTLGLIAGFSPIRDSQAKTKLGTHSSGFRGAPTGLAPGPTVRTELPKGGKGWGTKKDTHGDPGKLLVGTLLGYKKLSGLESSPRHAVP